MFVSLYVSSFLTSYSHFISLQRSVVKRYALASVVSPGWPPKKQFSSAGANSASAFGRTKFGAKTSDVDRAIYLAKQGKFTVQVIYPEKEFDLGGKYIKVVQYRGGGGVSLCFNSTMIIS
jgi:hypothetical protein